MHKCAQVCLSVCAYTCGPWIREVTVQAVRLAPSCLLPVRSYLPCSLCGCVNARVCVCFRVCVYMRGPWSREVTVQAVRLAPACLLPVRSYPPCSLGSVTWLWSLHYSTGTGQQHINLPQTSRLRIRGFTLLWNIHLITCRVQLFQAIKSFLTEDAWHLSKQSTTQVPCASSKGTPSLVNISALCYTEAMFHRLQGQVTPNKVWHILKDSMTTDAILKNCCVTLYCVHAAHTSPLWSLV